MIVDLYHLRMYWAEETQRVKLALLSGDLAHIDKEKYKQYLFDLTSVETALLSDNAVIRLAAEEILEQQKHVRTSDQP